MLWQNVKRNQCPIKAVGFDWDETLFEIDRGPDFYINSARYACKKAIEAVGLPADDLTQLREPIERFVASEHNASQQQALIEEAFSSLQLEGRRRDLFANAFKIYYPQYRVCSEFTGHKRLIPGAKETLLYLKKQHIPFFIASNFDDRTLRIQVAEALGDIMSPEDIEKHVFGSGYKDKMRPKPATDMLDDGFASLGVKPDKFSTFFVGNSVISDMPAAIRCGVMPILFTDQENASKAAGQEALSVRNFSLEEPLKTLIRKGNFDITKVEIIDRNIKRTHMIPMAHNHAGLREIFGQYIADFQSPKSQGR